MLKLELAKTFTVDHPSMDTPAKYLFYGATGVGKTYKIGEMLECPEVCPFLLLDVDRGSRTIAGPDMAQRIDRVLVRDMGMIRDVLRWLANSTHPYKAVAVDGLSAVYNWAMTERLNSPGLEIAAPQLQDWGHCTVRMRALLEHIQALPMHVIATCQEGYQKDEMTGAIYIAPDLPGKLAREVAGYFDLVARLTVQVQPAGGLNRVMQLQPLPRIGAKCRSPLLRDTELSNTPFKDLFSRERYGKVPEPEPITAPDIQKGKD